MAADPAQPLTDDDEAAGYRYELSILQAEFSLTQMLDRPVSGRIFFEQVPHDNLDIGRPDQVSLVFDRRIRRKGRHPTPSRFRTRVITTGDRRAGGSGQPGRDGDDPSSQGRAAGDGMQQLFADRPRSPSPGLRR